MDAAVVEPRAVAAPVPDSDDASEDYADDEASVQEQEAGEHERRVTALLEGLLPHQRNEYLQQLYTTPEYSSCPRTYRRFYVTPPPTSVDHRGADAFWPGTQASLNDRNRKAAAVGISRTWTAVDPKRPPKKKKKKLGAAAPGAGISSSKRSAAGLADGVKGPKTKAPGAARPEPLRKAKKLKDKPVKVKRPAKPVKPAESVVTNPFERGVTMRPSGKWQAQMYFAGKSRYIGVFDSRDKALVGYEIARKILKPVKLQELTPQLVDRCVSLARKSAFDGVEKMFPAKGRKSVQTSSSQDQGDEE